MVIKKKNILFISIILIIFSIFWTSNLELAHSQNAIINNIPETGLPDNPQGIKGILTSILSWILGILGLIAIISFVISGILYLTASGDERQLETAKRAMTYSIVGVVIALAGYIIVRAVDAALQGATYF